MKFLRYSTESSVDKYQTILGAIVIILVLLSRFWVLDKGLIVSDDGWYLTLIRDNPSDKLPSNFYRLFQFGIQSDIYLLRLVSLLLQLLSVTVFGFGIYQFQKKQGSNFSLAFCFGRVALGFLEIPAISSPNYINLNLIFGLLSVAFLLLWISYSLSVFILCSAFFCSFLFISQITCLVLLPSILLIVILQSSHKVKDIILFVVGIVLFFLLYFCIESPIEIYNRIAKLSNDTINRGSAQYGIFFLVKWTIFSLQYIFKYLLAAIAFKYGCKYIISKNINNDQKLIYSFLLLCLIIAYTNLFIYPSILDVGFVSVSRLRFLYFFVFYFVIVYKGKHNLEEICIIILLLLMPVFLSFGTNVDFPAKYPSFIVFLLPIIFILSKPSLKQKKIGSILFALLFLLDASSFVRPNWHGDVPYKQTISVKTIGINQNIKLDEHYIEQLKFCQKNIDSSISVLPTFETWGIVSLLDYQPISHKFLVPTTIDIDNRVKTYMNTHDKLVVLSTSQDSIKIKQMPNIHVRRIEQEGIVIYNIWKQLSE